MKKLLGLILIMILVGCEKSVVKIQTVSNIQPVVVVKDTTITTISCNNVCLLSPFYSNENKKTSWFKVNSSFDGLFSFSNLPQEYWKQSFGWQPDLGGYIYTDLTGDNKKDLFLYYLKSPWPTNQIGLNIYSEFDLNKSNFVVQPGLTQTRKVVLSDINNDNNDEIISFSSGYDKEPWPGDSIQIFYPKSKTYRYLSEDIGYFHTGATGDINNDGQTDIVAFSGFSQNIKTHATCYLNKGNGNFELRNDIFQSIRIGYDNFYTMELFDINSDGWLDILLGGNGEFSIIINNNGTFSNRIDLRIDGNDAILDIGFFDLDKNGKMDLVINSTTLNYDGYKLYAFLQYDNLSFSNKTSDYFNQFQDNSKGTWIKWLRFFDYDRDGDVDIVGDGLYGSLLDKKIWWENNSNKFTKNN